MIATKPLNDRQSVPLLIDPFLEDDPEVLKNTIREQAQQIRELEAKVLKLETTLENRKLIERAKGIVMKKHHLTEDGSYRAMQRTSMHLRVALVELCKRVIQGKDIHFIGVNE